MTILVLECGIVVAAAATSCLIEAYLDDNMGLSDGRSGMHSRSAMQKCMGDVEETCSIPHHRGHMGFL